MDIGKFILLLVTAFLFSCNNESAKIKITQDFYLGIEKAKEFDKPIFLYFSCYGCMANDEFNKELIESDEIKRKLNDNFITIILHVDDTTSLNNLVVDNYKNITIGTIGGIQNINLKDRGHLNSYIQKQLFGQFYQPMYVIITNSLEVLVKPFGYTKGDKKFFLDKLEEGLKKKAN